MLNVDVAMEQLCCTAQLASSDPYPAASSYPQGGGGGMTVEAFPGI